MLGLIYRYGIYLPDLAPFPIINNDLLGAKTPRPFDTMHLYVHMGLSPKVYNLYGPTHRLRYLEINKCWRIFSLVL